MGLRTLLTNFETGKQAYPFHNTPEDVGGFNYSGVNKNSRSIFDEGFVFNGWTFSSSPSVQVFDHPVYDLWVLKCY